MNIIKDLHHLVEKQRFKHVKSLSSRAFLRCSWIKGPNFRTLMKAVGVLSSLKAGTCTPAHSGGRLKHTTKKHVQHPLLPAAGNVHLSFRLYFLLAVDIWILNPGRGVHHSTGPGAALPDPGCRARSGSSPALQDAAPPARSNTGPPHRALPWVQECPVWPPHHAAPRWDLAHTGCTHSFRPVF